MRMSINATTLNVLCRFDRRTRMCCATSAEASPALCRRGQSLLDALLDISKLDAHAREARKEAVDCWARFLRATKDEYEALAAQKGLVPGSLELPSWPCLGAHRRDLFNRIVGNLVNNALKFTNVGSVDLRGRLLWRTAFLVDVRDNQATGGWHARRWRQDL